MTSASNKAPDSVVDPEAWDYLARHRDRKQRCLDEALQIHASCPRDPGHVETPVSDCKACHLKIIDLIAKRYTECPETEWYATRQTFLQHLLELFPAVRRGEVDASGIEDRVVDEKQKWHRDNVRRVAAAMAAFGMPERREELIRLLADQKLKFRDFCERVNEVIAGGLKDPCPPDALERLIATRNDPPARLEAYKEVFFFPHGRREEEIRESTRKYLEMIEQGVPMTKIASAMVEDKRQSLANQPRLKELQTRLETLKKAKVTYLTQRENKSRDDDESKAPPPCHQCGSAPEVANPASCAICQIAVAHGFMEEAVVFCREECQRLGYGDHVDQVHKCSAGDRCMTLHSYEVDEATDPTNEEGDAYLCRECLEQRKSLEVFCTLGCADANFDHHCQDLHPWTIRAKGAGHTQAGMRYTEAQLLALNQALQDMQNAKVIDRFDIEPKLAPAAKPHKGKAVSPADEPIDEDQREATAHVDEMDLEGANARYLDNEPINIDRSTLRHDDDRAPDDVEMQDVPTQRTPKPTASTAHNHTEDTEMMEAVDVADFGERTGAAAADKPGATETSPLAQEPAEGTRTESQPSQSLQAPPVPSPLEHPNHPVDPSLHVVSPTEAAAAAARSLPIASAEAAEEARQPAATIEMPERITSIEPMPSLGRSLEIEIAKIPAGVDVRSPLDGAPPTKAEQVARRAADVNTMDVIADGKAGEDISPKAALLRDDGPAGAPIGDGRENRLGRQQETGGADTSGAARAGGGKDEASTATSKGAVLIPDQIPLPLQPKDDTAPVTTATRGPKSAAEAEAEGAAADVSQKSSDNSMEEGEISEGPPEPGIKKRKASSVEPGEVEEEDENEQPKKARNLDSVGGRGGGFTDKMAQRD